MMEAAGVKDVLSKSLGSANMLNVVRATMAALAELKDVEREAALRGKTNLHVAPHWARRQLREGSTPPPVGS